MADFLLGWLPGVSELLTVVNFVVNVVQCVGIKC